MAVWCALAFAATTATSTAPTKKKTTKRPAHSAATKSTSAHSSTTAATAKPSTATSGTVASKSRTARSSKTRRVVRSYQQAPTGDRYREIQQALISKGYLHGEANGEWGADSVDALKRFQTDQNLTADGKIGSLSLIALGLGPKRITAQSNTPAASATPSTQGTPSNTAIPTNQANPASPASPPNQPGSTNPLK
jgi:murein L,D-transpeptidase YcbB/YkuD